MTGKPPWSPCPKSSPDPGISNCQAWLLEGFFGGDFLEWGIHGFQYLNVLYMFVSFLFLIWGCPHDLGNPNIAIHWHPAKVSHWLTPNQASPGALCCQQHTLPTSPSAQYFGYESAHSQDQPACEKANLVNSMLTLVYGGYIGFYMLPNQLRNHRKLLETTAKW